MPPGNGPAPRPDAPTSMAVNGNDMIVVKPGSSIFERHPPIPLQTRTKKVINAVFATLRDVLPALLLHEPFNRQDRPVTAA